MFCRSGLFPTTSTFGSFGLLISREKLSPVITQYKAGEIIKYQVTPGNVDDKAPLNEDHFTKKLFGKLIADRGYISKSLFDRLFIDDIHMITKLKKNMKNSLISLYDKMLLRKRALVETVNDLLKNVCQIEHTRHRSVGNFGVNLISGLIAYNLLPKKPELNIEIVRKPHEIATA